MADEMIYTMGGTKLFISESPVPSKLEVEPSDFQGINWIEVGGLYNVGELGGEQAINEYELISTDWVLKSKGSRNGGTMTNVFIPMAFDAGQLKLQEAVEEKCRPYAFKLERGADCAPQATVTISAASPGVVTWEGHGLNAGQPIVFSSSGSLPTGLTEGVVYYVIATGLTQNSFSVSATPGGTGVGTTGAGSGTITAVASPAGMTDLFQGLATDGARSGGARNDEYTSTLR